MAGVESKDITSTLEKSDPEWSKATPPIQQSPCDEAAERPVPIAAGGQEAIPDGGWEGWRQVAAAHVVVAFSWGLINSFGFFQTYYTQLLGVSSSSVAWIGSIQIFLIFFVGVFSGSAFDAGHSLHLIVGSGCLLNILGIFMTSISKTYWQFMLSHGICCGLSNGLMFTPSMAVVRTYFHKRKSLAMALVLCGSGTGGMVIPAVLETNTQRIGFGWAVRIVGLLSAVLLPISCFVLRRRSQVELATTFLSVKVLKELDYMLFNVAMFMNLMGLYFAYFFVPDLAQSRVGFSFDRAIDLLILINGLGIPGRVGPMWLADKISRPVDVLIPVNLVCAILTFASIAIKDSAGVWAFVVLYGLFGAALIGLFPAGLAHFSGDLSTAGSRIGWGFTIESFAILIGPPITGALLRGGSSDYWRAQTFAGSCFSLGFFVLVTTRLLQSHSAGKLSEK
ncbi:MFS-type transporter [Exophiala dermatitidis]